MQQHGGNCIVAIREDIGSDAHRVARDALDREAAAINLRRYFFDDNARSPILDRRDGPLSAGGLGKFCMR
jgi:hypothetical protein